VAGAITKRQVVQERGELFGRAFEPFVFMELTAHSSYSELDYEINFWRTKSGFEVDFILGNGGVAIEVRGSDRVDARALRPLNVFIEEYSPRLALVVCNEPEERIVNQICIMPWGHFLNELWKGRIVKEGFPRFRFAGDGVDFERDTKALENSCIQGACRGTGYFGG
jgi:hypothetical protein